MIECNSYNIHINDWEALKTYIKEGKYSKLIVIVDENTHHSCLPTLKKEIEESIQVIRIEAGESEKTIDTCKDIWREMIDLGADRHSLCINLGGGVIGDMGGFTAATYMRGMDFIQIPTTLLSQVDASVGGKLGVDFDGYKNLVGIISEPGSVFIYTEFLNSLPYKQLLSGFAELIKHGLIMDKNVYLNLSNLISLEAVDWAPIITESVRLKKNITDQDPNERGLRKILNFGHTLGHAIESICLSTEDPLLHGEAIAIGMVMESYLSCLNNSLDMENCRFIKQNIIKLYGHHPEKIASLDELLLVMKKDKKNKSGNISFTLLNEIGRATYDNIMDDQQIQEAIEFYKEG